ncbi:MAG: hypothetical protein QW666_00015 [Candidatus Woesearchaeota archaeon]
MGGRRSAQNWYQDKRARYSGETKTSNGNLSGLRAGKNGHDPLDIRLFCRILVPDNKNDCEVSLCADDKPTKCYHVWQKILYAPVHDSALCKPLYAPRRIIIPSKIKNNAIQLGEDMRISLYVNKKEIPGDCSIDKNFTKGLDIIINELIKELPHAEFSQRLASPQNKGKLLKYFSKDFVESIKKEYSYGMMKLELPESININRNA